MQLRYYLEAYDVCVPTFPKYSHEAICPKGRRNGGGQGMLSILSNPIVKQLGITLLFLLTEKGAHSDQETNVQYGYELKSSSMTMPETIHIDHNNVKRKVCSCEKSQASAWGRIL